MEKECRVRLFREGQDQAVRIPKDFELEGKEAILRKVDDYLILEPDKNKGLLKVLTELGPLDEEFPDVDEGLGTLESLEI